jgi:hypothetical protein
MSVLDRKLVALGFRLLRRKTMKKKIRIIAVAAALTVVVPAAEAQQADTPKVDRMSSWSTNLICRVLG